MLAVWCWSVKKAGWLEWDQESSNSQNVRSGGRGCDVQQFINVVAKRVNTA